MLDNYYVIIRLCERPGKNFIRLLVHFIYEFALLRLFIARLLVIINVP